MDLGLNQKEASEKLRVDETTVHNWERNHTVPVVRFIPRIIEFLGYAPFHPTNSLPERLRAHRLALGLSCRGLAKRLGVDEGSLRSCELGFSTPSKTYLSTIDNPVKDRTTTIR